MLLEIEEPGLELENKEKPEIIMGIDFGTTNSLASLFDGEKIIEIPIEGVNILNSSVLIDGLKISSIKRVFGKNLDEIKNGNFIDPSIKDNFLEDEDGNLILKISNKEYYPIEIASKIFEKLKSSAHNFLDIDFTKAVITVPAYFDDAAKDMVKKSASLAGIEAVRLLAEPTAAAYFYGLDTKSEGDYIVYDLGGGTFDVSILRMQMGAFRVISTGGNSLLGGDDIDIKISKCLENKFNEFKDIPSNEKMKISKYLKEDLSNSEESTFGEFNLSRNEFVELSSDLINETIRITKKTIYDSKIKDFNGIILVGGSSRLYSLKDKLSSEFSNIKIIDDVDPDKIVCFGAAKQGYNLSHKNGDLLIDVIPLSLGLELYGGLSEKLIYRNTAIPSQKTVKYTTQLDNQTAMDFHIVQGDRELAKDCRSLAKFKLSNIPKMIAGMPQIEVTFTVDNDGLLQVKAKELSTGSSQSIEVKPTFGLDENKMFDMLKNAVDNSEKDFEDSKRISYKIDLESSLLKLKKLVEKNKEILDKSEYNNLIEISDIYLKDIESKTIKELEDIHDKLNEETKFFVERIMNLGLDVHIKGKNIDNIIN